LNHLENKVIVTTTQQMPSTFCVRSEKNWGFINLFFYATKGQVLIKAWLFYIMLTQGCGFYPFPCIIHR